MTVNANSASILPEQLSWASAIGNFLINFGFLHHLVMDYLNNALDVSEFDRWKEKPFKDQTMRIAQHLKEMPSAGEKEREFELLMRRLDPIRTLRNHVAHGHILCRWDVTKETWAISISLPKNIDSAYATETRHLTWTELRASLDELTEVIEAFMRFTGKTSYHRDDRTSRTEDNV